VSGFSGLDRVVVATDHEEIVRVIEDAGGEAILTSEAHPSGTDRVAEVSSRTEFREYPIVVNVQGDEPGLDPVHVVSPVEMLQGGDWDVTTCAAPLLDEADWRAPSVVKVARAGDGRALYFSRAPIPHPRDGSFIPGDDRWLHHVGVYVYRREALERWVALPPSRLESTERLEQLRALEAGISIGVATVSTAPRGIDTEQDLDDAHSSWGIAGDEGAIRVDAAESKPSESR